MIINKLKKAVYLIFPILIWVNAYTQPKAGDFAMGGGFGFNQSKNTHDIFGPLGTGTRTSFWLTPQAGYFIHRNFLVSVSVLMQYDNSVFRSYFLDSAQNRIHFTNKYAEAQVGFGGNATYLRQLYNRLFLLSSIAINHVSIIRDYNLGEIISGQRVINNIGRNINIDLQFGLQYYIKPTVAVHANARLISVDYNKYNILAANSTFDNSVRLFGRNTITAGLTFLIISKND